jgi:hypothetical protein
MANEVNNNVYVRPNAPGAALSPLVVMSPAATDSCTTSLTSLDEFRKLMPAFEVSGSQLDRTPNSVFKGLDLGRYELTRALPATPAVGALPADVRKLLGWNEEEARSAGAYPFRR